MSWGAVRWTSWALALVGAVAIALGSWGGPGWLVYAGAPVVVVFLVVSFVAAQRERRQRWHRSRAVPPA